MEHLHLIPNEKFTAVYIDFINTNFNVTEHQFIVIGTNIPEKISKKKNVKIFERMGVKEAAMLTEEVDSAKNIYWHGMFNVGLKEYFFERPWLVRKMSWIVWGGDMYPFAEMKRNNSKSHNLLLTEGIIKQLKNICTLTKGDYEIIDRTFDHQSRYMKAVYINPIEKDFLNVENVVGNEGQIINIQVGNSATETNNHKEALKLLEQYKDENIKIYCPLSYGSREYAEEVIEAGKLALGEKFIPMLDFLDPKEYTTFLQKMDILILNCNRQQGLGNVYAYAAMGKKVYIRRDTTSWEYLTGDCELTMFDTQQLENTSFTEFTRMSQDEKMNNQKKGNHYFYSQEFLKEVWVNIFRQGVE